MILVGDCLAILPTLPADHFDSVVTDPPYGLGFMGKAWDHAVPGIPFWEAMLRVAKPGAYLAAFGGTRTFHRMAVAIEDAGRELRDTLMWVYGSGFPKSYNGDWGGTALKPAWEPIVLARKPVIGTVAANFDRHGTGGLNVDGCRIDGAARPLIESKAEPSSATFGDGLNGSRHAGETTLGRWPANLVHDGSAEVVAAFPSAPGQQGDTGPEFARRRGACYGEFGKVPEHKVRVESDTSAARFFYCAKASREDRNDGCAGFEERPLLWSSGDANPGSFQAEGTKRAAANNHPTVKPTELMRWLCRLVTPTGGHVLDPFAGSGSTGRAAVAEGLRFTGIELSPDYAAIAEARVRSVQPGLALGVA